MPWFGSVGGASGGSSSPATGLSTQVVQRAAAGFRATMTRGYHSTCIQMMGDSTGDEQGEWFGKLADKVAAAYPGYSVTWKPWNPTTNYYDGGTAVSAGTFNGGGSRRVNLAASPTSTLVYPSTNTLGTGDLEVTVHHTPDAGWAPGSGTAARTMVSRYNASGTSRAFWLYLDVNGFVKWTWSAAGTADTGTVTSTVAVPFTGTTAGRVRVYHDVDNTASGNDVYFYTSTDGTTWTQLGATVTTAGVTTSGSASVFQYQLGGRNAVLTPTDLGPGDYYSVNVRTGTRGDGTANGPGSQICSVPVYPEHWQKSLGTPTLVGAPRIVFLSGSASGQASAYFSTGILNDSGTRRSRVMEQHGQQIVFLSDGHNEANDVGQTWRTTYNTWLTDVKSRCLGATVVCLAQNPTYSNLDPLKGREMRGAAIISIADSQGAYGIDVWPQFSTDQTVLATQLLDNIHPNLTTGSQLWADYVYNQLALGG